MSDVIVNIETHNIFHKSLTILFIYLFTCKSIFYPKTLYASFGDYKKKLLFFVCKKASFF